MLETIMSKQAELGDEIGKMNLLLAQQNSPESTAPHHVVPAASTAPATLTAISRMAASISDLLLIREIDSTFVYIPGLFKCIHCHDLDNEAGIACPIQDEFCYDIKNGKRVQSNRFRNLKRTLFDHLKLRSHIKKTGEADELERFQKKRDANFKLKRASISTVEKGSVRS